MASDALIHDRLETRLSQLLHASLAGPGAGALLLVSVLFINDANLRISDLHRYSLDGQIALRLFVCAACGLYGLAHLPRTYDTLLRFPGAWCVLFGLWSLCTVPFAVDKSFAAAACVSLWCMICFIPAVLSQLGGRRITILVAATLTVYMVVGWVVYFAIPPLGRTPYIMPNQDIVYRMGGLNHANSTGRLAALAIAMLLALGFERVTRWKDLVVWLAFLGTTLYCTNSRTAFLAAASLGVVCVRYVPAKVLVAAALALFVVGGVVAVVFATRSDEAASALTRSGESQELYRLTGRTDVWEYVIEKIWEKPIVGQGYGCSRFVMAEYNEMVGEDLAGYHAHNTLLNVALGSGVVGGLLFLAMIFHQVVNFVKRPSVFPDMILMLVVVAGIADAVAFSPIPDVFTVLWLIALFWRQTGMSLKDDSAPLLESVGR